MPQDVYAVDRLVIGIESPLQRQRAGDGDRVGFDLWIKNPMGSPGSTQRPPAMELWDSDGVVYEPSNADWAEPLLPDTEIIRRVEFEIARDARGLELVFTPGEESEVHIQLTRDPEDTIPSFKTNPPRSPRMRQDVDVLDTTLQKTHAWINEVADEAGWDDKHKAYLALRAVLHVVRDRLTVEEAADLSAQLPMLVRGLYFEGWHPAGKPVLLRSREEFLDAIAGDYPFALDAGEPELMLRSVFRVIQRNVDRGEVEHVAGQLPGDVRELLAA